MSVNETFVEFAPKSSNMETLRTGTDPPVGGLYISPFDEMGFGFE